MLGYVSAICPHCGEGLLVPDSNMKNPKTCPRCQCLFLLYPPQRAVHEDDFVVSHMIREGKRQGNRK
jgi:hypothetical protein